MCYLCLRRHGCCPHSADEQIEAPRENYWHYFVPLIWYQERWEKMMNILEAGKQYFDSKDALNFIKKILYFFLQIP